MGDDVVWFWESSWVFGPGGSFFVWVRGMGGGTNGQSASGAAAGAEFFVVCWEMVWHRRCAGCGWGEFFWGLS